MTVGSASDNALCHSTFRSGDTVNIDDQSIFTPLVLDTNGYMFGMVGRGSIIGKLPFYVVFDIVGRLLANTVTSLRKLMLDF